MKHQNLLVANTIEAVKQRLETTLGNIEFQKGQVFWDDIEKLQHCIKALENIQIDQYEEIIDLDGSIQYVAKY
tara:strand:- start:28 stop:246 length:219 start_codon:yes stop_codon:yes gene_type:complete